MGKRLPNLATLLNDAQTVWQSAQGQAPTESGHGPQHLNDAQTVWQSVLLQHWYGNRQRQLELCTGTAVWYHTGKPVRFAGC
jgi:hypothetical protein